MAHTPGAACYVSLEPEASGSNLSCGEINRMRGWGKIKAHYKSSFRRRWGGGTRAMTLALWGCTQVMGKPCSALCPLSPSGAPGLQHKLPWHEQRVANARKSSTNAVGHTIEWYAHVLWNWASSSASRPKLHNMAVVVKTNGIPCWGGCTTHFGTYFSGDWDVHWGYGILTHGHMFIKDVM